MLVFNSDLDNTLIYSYKHEIGIDKKCVELYQNREVSFITEKSLELLREVKNRMLFVPTTTRTVEQYQRINLGVGDLDYALVCNGGVLLVNGQEDSAWYEESRKLVWDCQSELEKARAYLEKDIERSFEIRTIMALFVFTKSNAPVKTAARLKEVLDLQLVDVFYNGVKVYVVPKKLDKGSAVCRLKDRLKAGQIIAAGDSEFDIPMLQAADIAIAPAALAEQYRIKEDVVVMKDDGIFSDQLLEYIKEWECR